MAVPRGGLASKCLTFTERNPFPDGGPKAEDATFRRGIRKDLRREIHGRTIPLRGVFLLSGLQD